jgi:hypothetical protein
MATKASKTPIPVTPLGWLEKTYVGILLAIFGGIVLHAPLTVGLGVLFPSFDLIIKSWKEILMGIASVIALILLYRKQRFEVLKHPVMYVIAGYALLHLLLLPVLWQGATASIAGLFIDLRYLLFFVLVYTAVALYPRLRSAFIYTFFAGAFVVAAFSMLQVFVLPHDVLKYIGYGNDTIVPYLTVDQNPEFVRINSTLRGPNPLGAYAGIVLALLFAFWLRAKQTKPMNYKWAFSVIVIGSFVGLWVSYSRSALVAAIAAFGIVALATIGRQLPRKVWIGVIVAIFALGGAFAFGATTPQGSIFVSNVILHENAATGSAISSNDGHVESLRDGVARMLRQPLGGGVGSTGSASLHGDSPLIIENQFLFIAHETGWLGLILFATLTFLVLRGLWRNRADWLALGVFAGGIAMVLIGLLLPVWVDDTVSIIWWGLAAVALAGTPVGETVKQMKKRKK